MKVCILHVVPSDQTMVNEDHLMQPSNFLHQQPIGGFPLSSDPQVAQTGTTTTSSSFPPTPRPSVDSAKETGVLATQLLVI